MKIKIKGEPINTSGSLPPVGSKAPDFVLVDQNFISHSLKDFSRRRKLLSIVPSLDTSVCSLSAKKMNDAMKSHPEAVTLIISADTPFAQKRVCGLENLNNILTLSTIRSKNFATDYGVLIMDGNLEGFCARAVLVLDEEDRILYEELVPDISEEPNYEAAFKTLFHT